MGGLFSTPYTGPLLAVYAPNDVRANVSRVVGETAFSGYPLSEPSDQHAGEEKARGVTLWVRIEALHCNRLQTSIATEARKFSARAAEASLVVI